jgi:hypothetical protein
MRASIRRKACAQRRYSFTFSFFAIEEASLDNAADRELLLAVRSLRNDDASELDEKNDKLLKDEFREVVGTLLDNARENVEFEDDFNKPRESNDRD